MFGFEEQRKEIEIREMFERIDEMLSDLRLEYMDLARRYDATREELEDLEAECAERQWQ